MKELIIKYLSESISDNELELLQELLENPENQKEFEYYLEIDLAFESSATNVVVDDAFEKVRGGLLLGGYEKKKARSKLFIRYAAAIAAIVGLFFIYQSTDSFGTFGSYSTVESKNASVQLILANGDKVFLEVLAMQEDLQLGEGKTAILSKEKISYSIDNDDYDSKELSYNELHVPFGKTFQLILSDGTSVRLNSGSSLRYPVQFLNGMDRRVFLEGEGYFNVSTDKEHPYIVKTNEVDVTVLGTRFNIASYDNDEVVRTVLVEGKVKVSSSDSENNNISAVFLRPNERASFTKSTKTMAVESVDSAVDTSWLEGKLLFSEESFGNIIKKLERKFNIKIQNNYQELNNEVFSAKFESESPEQILNVFSKIRGFSYGTGKDGTIYITKL